MQLGDNKNTVANCCIRKGDKVLVISGNERSKMGKVLTRIGDRVIVQGLNIRKKHMKRTQQKPKGEIIELEAPIHASNLKLVNENDQPIKVKTRVNAKGERERYYVENGQQVLFRQVKTAK